MMPTAQSERLLTRLEKAKTSYGPAEARTARQLLSRLGESRFTDAPSLIRFHDALLFLRAYPHNPAILRAAESLLSTLEPRVKQLRAAGAALAAFDEEPVSGIAGTDIVRLLSYDDALWLARTYAGDLSIDWDTNDNTAAMGNTWPRFFPLLDEDAFVEPDVSYPNWLAAAKGEARELDWLLRRFARLPLAARHKAELYESLQMPLRWRLGGSPASRTRGRSAVKRVFYQDSPLIPRSAVSLAAELSKPAPRLEVVPARPAQAILRLAREALLVRYRGLYGMTFGDSRLLRRADVGRGTEIFLWGIPPERRLPLRAYCSGFTLRNGVPTNYVEAIALFDWVEIGFNSFYAYREGETAWVYAQMLRVLRQLLGASCFAVYPYQIGFENEEAIQSGAFWFYRKLGFRPGSAELLRLAETEEKKIAAKPGYRTPPRILRQLAQQHVFYELDPSRRGDWDGFRMRNLGYRVQQRMEQRYGGDAQRMRRESGACLAGILDLPPDTLNPCQRQALENFAVVLDAISEAAPWDAAERELLRQIIFAKAAKHEWAYLRLLRKHGRLRQAVLRLGAPQA